MARVNCAAGLLIKGQRLLLGKRNADRRFYPNVWDLPGGHCRDEETLGQALKRELREELGIEAEVFNHVSALCGTDEKLGDYDYHIYVVTRWSGEPRNMTPDEHSEIRWFTLAEASVLELALPDYPALFRRLMD